MKTSRSIGLIPVVAALVLTSAGPAYASVSIRWAREFGTPSTDVAWAVTHGRTGIYVAGETSETTVWVRKYSFSGSLRWTESFPMVGFPTGVAVGGGLVYVSGDDSGVTCADSSAGFLAAITTSGSLRWVNPYTACPRDVEFRAVAADSSGAFVVGDTDGSLPGHVNRGGWDAVLFKVDPSGSVQWTKQFGTSNDDAANSVAIGGGDVFVAGDVEGALPGQPFVGARDALVRTFTGSGVRLWTSEFGAPDGWAIATAVAANSSGIAVGGPVRGTLPGQTYAGGLSDGFLREYSVGGSVIWTREFGTSGTDNVSGVSGRQTIWVVGTTDGGFRGAGSGDLFLRRFDLSGNTTDTTQFGTGGTDSSFGISATRRAGFVVGDTNGTWPGQTNAGGSDAFVLKVA